MTLQKVSALGLLISSAVLAAAYYLEYQYMLATCPLCILQRIVFMALCGIFLLGTIFKLRGIIRYVYSSSLILLSVTGAAIAARQLWLQYFAPPQKISCAASLERLFDLYPALEALKVALTGSGECALIDFTLLGLSIAAWSFMLFVSIGLVFSWVLYAQKNRRI